MNEIIQWDPFTELADMHRHLTSLFDRTPAHRRRGKEFMTAAEWYPVVDITEDDKAYAIKVELPEVKKEDVHVSVENGILTITGERKFEKEEKGRRYHRVEQAYGTFARSFSLPENIIAGKVDAPCKDGVLTVTVA